MRSMKTLALFAGLLAAPAAFAQGTAPAQPGTPASPAAPATPAPGTPGGSMGTGSGMGTGTNMGTGSNMGTGTGTGAAGTAAPAATPRAEGPPTTTTPAAGANSFTEGQARSRIEAAGYTNVQGLAKDDQGVWRGKAMRNGTQADVGLDFRGNVVTGSGAAR